MRLAIKVLATFFLSLTCLFGLGQTNVIMSNGQTETCQGAFFDSGGQGGPGYSNSEFFTHTICPDVPGDVISVVFNTFQLDNSGPQNSWDSVSIYDGNNTGEGFLGVYTQNELQGLTVTASPLNTSGCLTFVFQSNNIGTGNFNGTITCDTPCDRPEVEATYDAPDNKKICVGDVINFDGSASFAAPGFEITEWLWDFADGTTYTGGPIISHSWDEPGEYITELYIVDDNGCASTNLISLQVLVATFPSWDPFPQDATICLGESIDLEATPEQYNVTWAGPDVSYNNSTNVPLLDNVGQCYDSEIFVTGFAPGQTLNNINDLISIDVSIEHSFLFDLIATITCPTGQDVILHQQMLQPDGPNVGANGTDLGIPNTEFWDYSWANNAPLGTWSQEATGPGPNALPEGTYSSLQPLDQLVGCDLNGIWTISFCDMWGGDDGELNAWTLNFNPAIVPDVTEFTPIIGVEADSSFWSFDPGGLEVLSLSDDGNSLSVLPTEVGVYDFTYQVTNNHGCTHEETVTITVEQAAQADAGPDLTMCGPGTILQGSLGGVPVAQCSEVEGNYTYCYGNNENLTLTYCPDNQGDGITMIDISFNAGSVENFFDPFFVYDGPDAGSPLIAGPLAGNLAGQSWQASNPSGCLTIVFTSDGSVSCTSGSQTEWNYDVGCSDGTPDYEFEWSPADLVSDPNSPNPEVLEINGPTVFTFSTWPAGSPDCVSFDEVTVFPAFDFNVEFTAPSCAGNDGTITATIEPGQGDDGPWTITFSENGALVESVQSNGGTTSFTGLEMGNYTVTISDQGGCEYVNNIALPGEEPMVFEIDGDEIICLGGTATLEASSNMDVNENWTYTWDQGVGVGNIVEVAVLQTTTFTAYATDAFGCESEPVEFTVDVYDPLQVEIVGPLEICSNTEAELDVVSASGGLPPYNYQWSFDGQNVGADEDSLVYTQVDTGEYCVILTDVCETPPATDCFTVIVEEILVPEFMADTTAGCVPSSMQFEILNPPATFEDVFWEFGNGSVSEGITPAGVYINPGIYDVSISLTTPTGCLHTSTYPGYITVHPNPIAGFEATPQPTDILDTEISFNDLSSGGVVEWSWIFDTISMMGTSNETNPTFEFPLGIGGEYPVRLTVTDANGCIDQITRTIVINDLLNVYVPNSFTPNNDGVNDVFFVTGTDIDPTRFQLQVFNRWGEKIFETTDITQVWDGGVNNGQYYSQNDVYTWRLIVYSMTTVERYEMSGSVVVIR